MQEITLIFYKNQSNFPCLGKFWRLCAVLLPGSVSQHAKLGMFLRVVAGIFVKWCRTCHSTQFCCNFCALWQRHELVDVAAGEYASQLLGLSRAVCASSARGARSACQCCPVCCFSFFVRFSVLCAMWCANVPPVRYAGKFWRLCSALLPGSVSQHAKLGMFLRVVAGIFVKWCRTCHSTQFCCNFCALWQRHELVDVAAGEYASQLLGLSRAVCASSARGARSACQCCPVCCFSFFVRCGSGTYHIFFLLTVATNSLR